MYWSYLQTYIQKSPLGIIFHAVVHHVFCEPRTTLLARSIAPMLTILCAAVTRSSATPRRFSISPTGSEASSAMILHRRCVSCKMQKCVTMCRTVAVFVLSSSVLSELSVPLPAWNKSQRRFHSKRYPLFRLFPVRHSLVSRYINRALLTINRVVCRISFVGVKPLFTLTSFRSRIRFFRVSCFAEILMNLNHYQQNLIKLTKKNAVLLANSLCSVCRNLGFLNSNDLDF